MSPSFTSAATVDEALAALGDGARPVAGGTDLVVGARQGKAPLPDAIVAIDRIDGLRCDRGRRRGLRPRRARDPRGDRGDDTVRARFTALADASAIVGSHATRAQGTIGGNVMNASPAMDTGGPLLCFGAAGDAPVDGGRARRSRSPSSGRARARPSADPGELLVAVDVPAPPPGTGSALRPARVPAPDGDRGRRRDRGRHGRRRRGRRRPRRDHGARADDPPGPRGRGARWPASDGGARPRSRRGRGRGGGRVDPDQRRSRLGRLPPRDGRGRSRAARSPARSPGPAASRSRSRRAPRSYGDVRSDDEGRRDPDASTAPTTRSSSTRTLSLLSAVRDEIGLTGSKEGCDDSECGACMMLLDGKPVNSCSYLALQADGPRGHHGRGARRRRRARAAAGGVPAAGRRPVRVLHARHACLGDGAAARQPRSRPTRRSASACRGTSAAARATTASSARCATWSSVESRDRLPHRTHGDDTHHPHPAG